MRSHWRKPMDFDDEVLEQARAQVESLRNVFRAEIIPGGDWAALEAALDDDFNTADALAVMHGWRDHDLLRRALDVFGLGSLAEVDEAPADLVELAERRQQARASSDFDEADRLRAEIEAAGWEARDVAGGFQLVRRR
jgi:cysteinyl-tRNA synthetase